MARAKRHYIPGYVWHITHRCHKKDFLLKFPRDRRRWIEWLYQAKKRYSGLSVFNYMVTSNHRNAQIGYWSISVIEGRGFFGIQANAGGHGRLQTLHSPYLVIVCRQLGWDYHTLLRSSRTSDTEKRAVKHCSSIMLTEIELGAAFRAEWMLRIYSLKLHELRHCPANIAFERDRDKPCRFWKAFFNPSFLAFSHIFSACFPAPQLPVG